MSDCACIVPRHWPKNAIWAHHETCPKRIRLIEHERQRWQP